MCTTTWLWRTGKFWCICLLHGFSQTRISLFQPGFTLSVKPLAESSCFINQMTIKYIHSIHHHPHQVLPFIQNFHFSCREDRLIFISVKKCHPLPHNKVKWRQRRGSGSYCELSHLAVLFLLRELGAVIFFLKRFYGGFFLSSRDSVLLCSPGWSSTFSDPLASAPPLAG